MVKAVQPSMRTARIVPRQRAGSTAVAPALPAVRVSDVIIDRRCRRQASRVTVRSRDLASSMPLRMAGPIATSRASKRCSAGDRLTWAEKPAAPSCRITGSTSPTSQLARPEGWVDAMVSVTFESSPGRPKASRPRASTVVRPGRIGREGVDQPGISIGRRRARSGAAWLSPAMMAGRLSDTRPSSAAAAAGPR